MAVTWNATKTIAKLAAQGDKIYGRLRPKYALWYATGATVGTSLLHIRETAAGTHEIHADVAEQAQFSKLIALPNVVDGFEVDDLDVGYVLLAVEHRFLL